MRLDDDFQEINIAERHGEKSSSSTSGIYASGMPSKIVVADTSPLNYLIQIECDFLLPLLYRRIITPPIVITELTDAGTPVVVVEWALHFPSWLEVLPLTTEPDERLCLLDAGERDAIQLAIELRPSEILIDEFKGRREAQLRGFSTLGTLGVLIAAQRARLLDAHSAFERLIARTNFHSTPKLRHDVLELLRTSIDN